MMPIKEGEACPDTIHDLGCGYGETTKMIADLKGDEGHLVIVPYLTEVTRGIESDAISLHERTADCENTQ